eukprot:gene34579-42655_t
MDRLRCMMGSEPSGIFYSQVAYRTPVKGSKKVKTKLPSLDYVPGAEYHLDGSANGQGTRFPDPWTVMIGIALVDIQTLDMGNFTVFPGSHTGRDWSRYPEEKVSKTLPTLGETVHVCLPAGGVVFAHVLLAHRGGKNEKQNPSEEEEEEGKDNIPFSLNLDQKDTTSSGDGEVPDYVARFIPSNTREMVFIRVQARGIDYNNPLRAAVERDKHHSVLMFAFELLGRHSVTWSGRSLSSYPPSCHMADALDALGNTTAAVGKGFAVGSAVLTAVSLLTTFTVRVGIADTLDPINSNFFIPGVLVGAMLPYCFAALTMGAVAAAAGSVVIE